MTKIAIRWIYEACYEIQMSNGKHIIIDPDVSIHKFPEFSSEQFERCDYLLCTHTHFDHTSDIGYLAEKFQPRILVGELSAMPLARFFNLAFSCLYPVGNGEIYDFGDVKFQFYRAKHTKLFDPVRARPESTLQTTVRNWGLEGHGEVDQFGWLESYHILITCENSFKIMIVSGCVENQELYRIAEEFRPNILIRQPEAGNPSDYAMESVRYKAPIIFPHHHEKLASRWNMEWEDIEKSVQCQLNQCGSGTHFYMPEQYQWYEIEMGVNKK